MNIKALLLPLFIMGAVSTTLTACNSEQPSQLKGSGGGSSSGSDSSATDTSTTDTDTSTTDTDTSTTDTDTSTTDTSTTDTTLAACTFESAPVADRWDPSIDIVYISGDLGSSCTHNGGTLACTSATTFTYTDADGEVESLIEDGDIVVYPSETAEHIYYCE